VTGYLQRLATTAIHPSRGIKPVLQPVFAPARFEPAPLPSDERAAEVETEGAPESPRASRAPNVERETLLSPVAIPAIRLRESFAPPARVPVEESPDKNVFQPLLVDSQPLEASETSGTTKVHLDPAQAAEQDVPFRETAPERAVQDVPFREAAPERAEQDAPFRETPPERAVQINYRPVIGPRANAPPRQIRAHAPARDAAPEAEPDEIRIQIGRIEVIAVPPPAPQAPARIRKPAYKSLNLDEYLKRGR
jgi:hypothetical protein